MRTMRWFIVLFCALLVGIGGIFFLRGKGTEVTTANVTQGDLVQYVQTTGKVRLKNERMLFAQVDGIPLHVYVKEGEAVKKSQVLAEFDSTDVRYQLAQLKAELEQTKADLAQAKNGPKAEEIELLQEAVRQASIKADAAGREWNKARNLFDEGKIKREELQQRQDDLELAKSALRSTQINLNLKQEGTNANELMKYQAKVEQIELQRNKLEQDLTNLKVLSSLDGVITSMFIQEGQPILKGSPMFNMADPGQIEIVSEVKEALVPHIFLHQEAMVQAAALDKEQLRAHIVKIGSIASDAQAGSDKKTALPVFLELDPSPDSAKLLPGYNVDVNFVEVKASSVLLVPYDAVQRNNDGSSYVWTVRQGRAVRAIIEPGIQNESFLEVKKGLEVAATVITNAPNSLKDGQKVEMVTP